MLLARSMAVFVGMARALSFVVPPTEQTRFSDAVVIQVSPHAPTRTQHTQKQQLTSHHITLTHNTHITAHALSTHSMTQHDTPHAT